MNKTLLGDKVDTITSAVCYIDKVVYYCHTCMHTQDEVLAIYKDGARENVCLECGELFGTRRIEW